MLHIQNRLISVSKMSLAVSFSVQLLIGCAPKHQNETIAGVVVPIPAEMKKISQDKVNFGHGKASRYLFAAKSRVRRSSGSIRTCCQPIIGNPMRGLAQRLAGMFLPVAFRPLIFVSLRTVLTHQLSQYSLKRVNLTPLELKTLQLAGSDRQNML